MHSDANFFYLPYHNVGGHFLIWTVYFLSNQKFHWFQNQIYPVTQPKNFHGRKNFHANHQGFTLNPSEVRKFFVDIKSIDPKYFPINVYLANDLLADVVRECFGIALDEASKDQVDHASEIIYQNSKSTVKYLQDSGCPIVFIDYHGQDHLVNFYNDRYVTDWHRHHYPNKGLFLQKYIDVFFNDHTDLSRQEIWDQRELLALKIAPLIKKQDYSSCIDKEKSHLIFNTNELWNFFDTHVHRLFHYLNLDLDESKFGDWISIYKQWKQVHRPEFARDINLIIDNIVTGKSMDLSKYNMTFLHEILIQHFLIYEKNLNLKNWNLTTFPKNTMDLHNLLEPNCHLI